VRRILRFAGAALAFALAGASAGYGREGEPFELVRSLQSLQDQVVQGNARAHAAQRGLLERIGESFDRLSTQGWEDPRNGRAAVVFVLSGGTARVLRKLMDTRGSKSVDQKLLDATLAYGEGRLEAAAELLKEVQARTLDPGMGGLVAYVQGELEARKEPAKALSYFDDARLLSPGTIVEDAALRRQVALLIATGDAGRYEMLAAQYLRRFPDSVYARGFRQEFAAAVAVHAEAHKPDRLARLESILNGIAEEERRELYLAISERAILNGRVEMARFAAAHAAGLVKEAGIDLERARLYEAAALIVTDDFERGAKMLRSVERSKLAARDAHLLDSAKAIAEQVRHMPGLPPDTQSGPAMESKVLAQAGKAVANVDRLLSGADKE
jgi:chemotaxis protein MotC